MFDGQKMIVKGFQLIGEFVFGFSQLEFSIRAKLKSVLNLEDDLFDIVISQYDFAKLCRVTEQSLIKKYPQKSSEIKDVFNECLGLNDHRVRISHALWTIGESGLVARYVTKGTLKPEYFYDNQQELVRHIAKAQQLMLNVLSVPRSENAA